MSLTHRTALGQRKCPYSRLSDDEHSSVPYRAYKPDHFIVMSGRLVPHSSSRSQTAFSLFTEPEWRKVRRVVHKGLLVHRRAGKIVTDDRSGISFCPPFQKKNGPKLTPPWNFSA